MLKTVNKLLNATHDAAIGNHKVQFKDNKRYFYYYYTAICIADDKGHEIIIDNGGFCTSSTTRAINDYIRYFASLNYAIIDNRAA